MSNNSWKQYGGISKMDNFNTINASTIIADQFVSRSVRPTYQLLNGTFEVTEDLISGNSSYSNVDTFSNRDIYTNNKLFFGNNTFVKDGNNLPTLTDVQKNTHAYLYGNDTNIGINTIIPKTSFNITGTVGSITDILTVESKNVLVRNIIAQNINQRGIVVNADDISSNILFYNDVSTNSINVPDAMIKYQDGGLLTTQTTEHILSTAKIIQHDSSGGTLLMNSTGTTLNSSGYLDVDISGEINFYTDTGFIVDSSNDFIINCSGTILSLNDLSCNLNSTGNIILSSVGQDGLGGNIILDSSGGNIEFNSGDIKLNTLLKFSPPERGVSNELLHNETVTIYDNDNTQFLPNVYNDPTILTGNSTTFIGKDPSANTFFFMNPATRKDGGAIGGGMAPHDSSRAMTVIGTTDSSGNYIPSQMTISGANKHKYISTVGINTHKPRTEDYVLDVNGPMHLGNGEINTIADNTYEITYMNFSKTNPKYGIAVGSPSTKTGSGVNQTENSLLSSANNLTDPIEEGTYTKLQTTSTRPSTGTTGGIGAELTIVALEDEITSITVTDSGNDYVAGDILTVTAAVLVNTGTGRATDLIFTLTADHIVDVAEYNQILLYTKDGGKKWNQSDIFEKGGLNTDIAVSMRYIDVFDDSYSAIAGENGNLFISNDYGQSWYKLQLKDVVTETTDYKTINIVEYNNNSNTHRIFISYSLGNSTGIYYFDCVLSSLFAEATSTTIEIAVADQNTTTISNTYDYDIHSASSTTGHIYYAGNGGTFSYDVSNGNLKLENDTTNYNNIYAFNDTHAIAVSTTGISYTNDIPVQGLIWKHKTFTELGLPHNMVLNSVFIQSLSNAIAVGSQGEFIYSTDWQNGVWQMVPDILLNSSGIRDRIRGSENNLKSISMPDIDTMIIADTITPFISNVDFNQTQLGYSKIQYCFLPNLFNRTNNTVLDVSGNIVISGDVEVFDGELLVNTIDYKSQNTADISGTMDIGTKTHVVNIGKTDERTKIEPAINRLFDTCDSVINIGVTDPLEYDSSAVLINIGNYSQDATHSQRKANKINIGGGKDILSLGGTIVYSSTEISSSKNKGFQINDLNLQDGIKVFMSTNNFTDDNLPTGVSIVNGEYTYTFDLPTDDISYNPAFETYINDTYKPNNSGGGAGIRVTDNLDRDAGYLVVSQDMSGWVMKPTNDGSNSIKFDVNSLILRDTDEWIDNSPNKNTDISYGIPEQITNGIVMLTRTTETDSSYALTVQQLDVNNILIRDSESSVTNQIIKTDVKVEGDLEIVGQLSATSVLNTYVVNATTTDYEFIVTQDMSLGGILFVGGNASFNSNMEIYGNVAIGKDNPVVTLDISATDALRLPIGETSDRPIDRNVNDILQRKGVLTPLTDQDVIDDTNPNLLDEGDISGYIGSIRYNTSNKQFEGFGPGEAWGSLGGVINVAQNTKITAESGPAEPNNQLRFYTANHGATAAQLQMIIDASSGSVAIGTGYSTDVSNGYYTDDNSNQVSFDISDNSLIVEGKVGIGTKSPNVILDISGTNAIRLPVGNGSQRPIQNSETDTNEIDKYIGSIRYHSVNQQFEGYGPGNAWGSLGGVINVAQNTKITASSPNADSSNNQLQFYTAPKVGILNTTIDHFTSRINTLTAPIDPNGDWDNLSISGGSGTGAKLQIKTSSTNYITQVTVTNGGSGYIKGDVLTVTAATLTSAGTGRTTDMVFTLTTEGYAGGLSTVLNRFLYRTGTNDNSITPGTYDNLPITGGTGSGAKLQIVANGSGILNITVTTPGSGYSANDVIKVTAADFQAANTGRDTDLQFTLNQGDDDFFQNDINLSSNDGNMAERMIVDANGYVGIGTTAPTALLEVNGDALINGLTVGTGGGDISTNTAFGIGALNIATSSSSGNTAFGYQTLMSNTTGDNNVALCYQSLQYNTTGTYNLAASYRSLQANTDGDHNIALGMQSLLKNTTGDNNIAIGYNALYDNTIGKNNIAIGYLSLTNTNGSASNNKLGINNTAFGNNSGKTNTTGSNNTYIGAYSDCDSNNLKNSVAIGCYSKITKDHQIVLGGENSGQLVSLPEVYIPGNLGIGTSDPTSAARLRVVHGSTTDAEKNISAMDIFKDFDGVGNTYYAGRIYGTDGTTVNETGIKVCEKDGDNLTSNATKVLNVMSDGQSKMVVTGAGNVGIGTTAPQTNLDISNNIFFDVSHNTGSTTYTNIITGADAYTGSSGNLRLKGGGQGSNNYIDINSSTGPLTLKTTADSLLNSVVNDGFHGLANNSSLPDGTQGPINVITPSGSGSGAKVTIVGDSGSNEITSITVTDPGSGYQVGDEFRIPGASISGRSNDLKLILKADAFDGGFNDINLVTNNTTRVHVNNDGNVGIGTSDATAKLRVVHGSTTTDEKNISAMDIFKDFSGVGNTYYAGRIYGTDSDPNGTTVNETGIKVCEKGGSSLTNNATKVLNVISDGDSKMIVTGAGNVGIGTTAPQTNLDISNNIFFDVSHNTGSTTYTNIITGADAYDQNTGNLRLKGGGGDSNDYIDINSSAPLTLKMEQNALLNGITGTSTQNYYYNYTGGGNPSNQVLLQKWDLETGQAATPANITAEVSFVLTYSGINGNAGGEGRITEITVINPGSGYAVGDTCKLDFVHNPQMESIFANIEITLTSGHFDGGSNINLVTNDTNRVHVNNGGYVGIGTNAPEGLLHISSAGDTILKITGDNTNGDDNKHPYLIFQQDGSYNEGGIFLDSGNDLNISACTNGGGDIIFKTGTTSSNTDITNLTGADTRMRIFSNGNVCIGTTTPQSGAILTINGETASTSFNSTSDIRHKENIHELENALEKILSIRGVNFTFIDDDKKYLRAGIIAQEVQPIIPELINTTDDEKWTANYDGLTPYLIESVKTLSKENETIKQENETIKQENETIKQENETLKTKVNSLETKMEMIMKHLNL